MFGETAIISCFFKICLCIIMIIQYKVRGGQPQRPVNFITRSHWDSNSKMGNHHRGKTRNAYQATVLDNLGGITTEARHGAHVKLPLQIQQCQPMQCQWNTERISHFHHGSQHKSRYTIGASPQRQDTGRMSSYRFRYTPASPCNASGTRCACPTTTRVASI